MLPPRTGAEANYDQRSPIIALIEKIAKNFVEFLLAGKTNGINVVEFIARDRMNSTETYGPELIHGHSANETRKVTTNRVLMWLTSLQNWLSANDYERN